MNPQNLIQNISNQLRIIKSLDKAYGSELSVDFNSFRFYPQNENKISEILAFLLDPNETHNQGDRYLNIFLNYLGISYNTSSVEVITEKTTGTNRRIDIWLSFNQNSEIIGIENKIHEDTPDQENQIHDYLEYLKKVAIDNYTLLYLAPINKELDKKSISDEERAIAIESGRLKFINYEEDIIPIVESFYYATQNDRVRSFIHDFKLKLENDYIGENFNKITMIKEQILESNESIESAFTIQSALDSIKIELKEKFNKQLCSLGKELNIEFNQKHSHFILPNLQKHYFKVNYEAGGIIYGIVKTPEQYDTDSNKYDIQQIVNGVDCFRNNKSSQWWPVWSKLYENIDKNKDFWIDVVNKKAINDIKNTIQQILAMKDLIDKY